MKVVDCTDPAHADHGPHVHRIIEAAAPALRLGSWEYLPTAADIATAERIARGAIASAVAHGRRERDGASEHRPGTRFDRNANGFTAEIAVARMLGLADWEPPIIATWRNLPDLPNGIEVRQATGHGYRLMLYPRDHDDAPFVLVTGIRTSVMVARGWLYGRDGKLPGWWDTNVPDPNYFVPQSRLRPMDTLPVRAV